MKIPFNDLRRGYASVTRPLQEAAQAVIESGWYVLGREVAGFEEEFARYCGVRHCVGVASGTDALMLALKAVGVGPGDEVATVANAGGYGTVAILAVGATPRYVDVDADSLAMCPASLEAAAGARLAAVIVTHLYGRLADMDAISRVTERSGIPIVEDCAQAHGAERGGRRAGSFGRVGCFSFYPTKNLGALGDGGAVTTEDERLFGRLVALRQYGWVEKYRSEVEGGRNSRLDEIQAAFLRAKLPLLDEWNHRRRRIVGAYREGLAGSGLLLPPPPDEGDVGHLFVVRHPDRDGVRARLSAAGVTTDVHYPIPDHRQPSAAGEAWARVALPVTEAACREVFSLPCFPELTDDEVEVVIDAARRAAPERR